jgi:hypothetical protein
VNKSLFRSWKKLLIAIIITTIFFFLLSYDIFLEYSPFLFLALLIGIIATIIFLITAINSSISERQIPSKWIIIACLILIVIMPLNYLYRNGLFWGKKIIEAAFLDDRSRMDLTLFENGNYLINSSWIFGEESFTGTYKMKNDTIEFTKYPVTDNDFIAKKIVIQGNKIYFSQDIFGHYNTTFYYFQIDFDKRKR